MTKQPVWTQFRRLLLGTVIEALLEEEIDVAFSTIAIAFDDASAFQVPRLNNYMRFKGQLTAQLPAAPDAAALARLRARLEGVWPEILAVMDIPMGDRLGSERNHVQVAVTSDENGELLAVTFDLEAD